MIGKYMCAVFLLCFLCKTEGFLLDGQTDSSGGLTENHFITLMKLLVEEKEQRHTLELAVTQLHSDFQSLHKNYSDLENNCSTIFEQYSRLKNETELQQIKLDEINQNIAIKKIFQAQIMRYVSDLSSNMSKFQKEVDDLAQLKNVNQLKDVTSLQSVMKTLQQGLLQVNITQQARGQDFLALYNMTLYLRSLSEAQAHRITGLSLQLDKNQQQIANVSNAVSMTGCVDAEKIHSAESVILFSDIKTIIGIFDVASFKTNGTFRCPSAGLYLITVTVTSGTFNAHYYVYINSKKEFNGFVSKHSPTDYTDIGNFEHPGTIIFTARLEVNDIMYVQAGKIMSISIWNSCLSITKIK
ncbi:Hypothetical predicted protein [Mytilus galloprovincialis]|uniref:C1q domain-containing protein n=1 Tax=Mytilus galloprovincialis TaxID=29158 RepID=A0A8B6FGG6_MYTGA|nr:Hypothetical predicted protein [Mytilus galloprovincialis]